MTGCTVSDKKIQILLSTYNGEKYLREQLDSYLALEGFEQVKVLIRDDGSTDSTYEILKEYQAKYGFEVIKGENLGINRSMFELFKACDLSCDFFALSDQDDVWLPHKLSLAIDKLKCFDQKKPILFSSCSQITDENLNPIGKSLVPKKGVSFFNAMIQNVCPGHTQVINRSLMRELIRTNIDQIYVIDYWIYMVASSIGEVVFDNQVTVLYRQHGNNTIGYEINRWNNLKKRIRRFLRHDKDPISKQLRTLYDYYSSKLPDAYREEIQRYFYCQKNLFSRIGYAFTSRAFRQTLLETWVFKILYIFGKYNER